jgi:hypothetical protein
MFYTAATAFVAASATLVSAAYGPTTTEVYEHHLVHPDTPTHAPPTLTVLPDYEEEETYPVPAPFEEPPSDDHHKAGYQCSETYQPNAAKYMSYVCSSLYAQALKWSTNNCKAYYAHAKADDKRSRYQANTCTYWSERSVMTVVSSCFMEAHLRTEFIQKYGKEGPGVWYCKYKDFIDQVMDCYEDALKYYPLGKGMNVHEKEVASLYKSADFEMPPFQFSGASVAMCAYYNKDQAYNRGE